MNPEKVMEYIGKELEANLKAMSKAKTAEEKVAYSQIIRNLSESMGIFLSLACDISDCCSDDEE
ncbi:MAG: hypothetical protein CSYNP_00990 [Syntrophus sp. SKADARSKE-3]|nr:hypothetical protein [Syntrophus sp. SKADARSKE-3]